MAARPERPRRGGGEGQTPPRPNALAALARFISDNSEAFVATLENKRLPLSQLAPGQEGVIVAIRSHGPLRRRLLEMGLVRGEPIFVERVAPLGDPVEYVVKGSHLSLRRRDAADIIVELNEPEAAHDA